MTSDTIRSTGAKPLLISLAVYFALLIVTGSVIEALDDPPTALVVALSLLPPAAAAAGMGLQRRSIHAREGIERTVYAESASIAFLITMLCALSYGFIQENTDAPDLNGFVVWSVGMGIWALISVPMNRRYR